MGESDVNRIAFYKNISLKIRSLREFLPWHSALGIQLQQLGALWRCKFDPLTSAGMGCSCGSIQTLAQKLPHAEGAAIILKKNHVFKILSVLQMLPLFKSRVFLVKSCWYIVLFTTLYPRM